MCNGFASKYDNYEKTDFKNEMLLVKTKLNISPIHGIGLFADEFIPAKTVVWKFHPVIDVVLTANQVEELSVASFEQTRKYIYRDKKTGLYVLCGDDARFFNHSNDPNCLDIYEGDEHGLTIARKNIEANEELTCDYSLFDLDLIEGKYTL